MKIKNKVIGLAGVAGAGKDLFFKILKESVPNVKRYALADELKEELFEWSHMNYGIDTMKCTREEKDLIRPLLVAHGNLQRRLSEGQYWTERLTKWIKDDLNSFPDKLSETDIICITDIRYEEYKKDEVHWLKNDLDGLLVHISKYTRRNNKRFYHPPANQAERENDPELKKAADHLVTWPHLKGSQGSIEKKLKKHVDKFILKFNIK